MRMKDLIPFRENRALSGGSDPFLALQHEMNRLFDDLWRGFDLPARGNGGLGLVSGTSVPRVDVSEDEKAIRVTADLPGLEEKDVDVTFADGLLTIRGETHDESEDSGRRYYVKERSYGAFQRALAVGAEVDEDKIEAKFKNGLLTVVLPKTEEAKGKVKRIPVTH